MLLYSQTGELELFLEETFKGKQHGYFIEVGAWNGHDLSQTAYMEEWHGWRGVCVDPFPRGFELRKCELCTKALSSDGKDREFIRVTTDQRDGGDVSYLSGFKDSIQKHWPFIEAYCNYTEVTVETITMDRLYEQYQLPAYIDFLSVDTEGAEIEIFSSINFSHYRYGVISFEHNNDEGVKRFLGRLLSSNGYVFSRAMGVNGIEDVYVSRELL